MGKKNSRIQTKGGVELECDSECKIQFQKDNKKLDYLHSDSALVE